MPTKITIIYDKPEDPSAFEAGFRSQLALAAEIPGVLGIESAQVHPKEDGGATPAYRLLDLQFADYAAASAAVETAAAGTLLTDVFARATGGVRIVFAETERLEPTPRSVAHAGSSGVVSSS